MLTNNHFKVSVFLHNRSAAPRTVSINSNSDWKKFCYSYNTQVKVVLSSHSSFYTGQKAHLVKRGEGSFTLKSGEKETLSMEVSPESYMDKVTQITPFQDAFPTYSARWLTCAWWRTTFWWLWLRLDSHGVRRMISFSRNQSVANISKSRSQTIPKTSTLQRILVSAFWTISFELAGSSGLKSSSPTHLWERSSSFISWQGWDFVGMISCDNLFVIYFTTFVLMLKPCQKIFPFHVARQLLWQTAQSLWKLRSSWEQERQIIHPLGQGRR